ncbi:MAG: AMP-binding protein [Proteobacteria bacterium]|nr:AMP-binding protein [Pseudomonadota bacterium]
MKAEIWEKFKSRFAIDEIIELYGFSEVRGTLINLVGKSGMVGRILDPAAAATIKLDLDAENFVRAEDGSMIRYTEPGDKGIYIINVNDRADSMIEYAERAETDKEILVDVFEKGDRWFNSGDLLELHDDGWLSFSDRLGDTYRWKGENVSTQEVESILADFSAVDFAAVYGVHIGDMSGQAGMATILMNKDVDWNWEEFGEFVQANLPSYAIPRFLRFRQQLEMTATHKVKNVDLKKEGDIGLFFRRAKSSEYVCGNTELNYEKVFESLEREF